MLVFSLVTIRADLSPAQVCPTFTMSYPLFFDYSTVSHSVSEGHVVVTRSVFANDKFVKLMQDVTRERKIFEK